MPGSIRLAGTGGDYVRDWLQRDLSELGIAIPAATVGRFWTMLAHHHGGIWNAAEFARSLCVAGNTARHHLDILSGVSSGVPSSSRPKPRRAHEGPPPRRVLIDAPAGRAYALEANDSAQGGDMTALVALLALSLAWPAAADDKKKEEKKPATSARSGPATPADLLRQADEKAAAGDLDGAAELLRRAAQADAASGEPSLRLGRLYERRHQLDMAAEAYEAAAGKLSGPHKAEALARLSIVQGLRGKPDLASAEAAAAADATGAWPLVAMARVKAAEGKADDAIALAEKAKAAGGGAAASAALGRAQEVKGDLKAAEAAYREAHAAEPAAVLPAVSLARVLRKTNRAAEAEPLVTRAAEGAPGAVDVYAEGARVKLALGRSAEAMADAQMAAAMAPDDPDAQALLREATIGRALGYLGTAQAGQAVPELDALRERYPQAADVHAAIGKVQLALGQVDPAVAAWRKAVEIDPTLGAAQFQLGTTLHLRKRDAAGAVAALEKAVAAEATNADYRTALGAALLDLKQYDRAVAELEKAVATPGYQKAEAFIHLGGAHLANKRYKDSVAVLDKAIGLNPDAAAAHAYLGWAYFGLKDAAGFKKHAGRAKSLGWKDATLLDYLKRIEAGEAIK